MTIDPKQIEEIMSLPYRTRVEKDTCGGKDCYVAYHDELEGCMAQGRTWQEAIEELTIARRDYIAASLKRGLQVPRPIYDPKQAWAVLITQEQHIQQADKTFHAAPGRLPYTADTSLDKIAA